MTQVMSPRIARLGVPREEDSQERCPAGSGPAARGGSLALRAHYDRIAPVYDQIRPKVLDSFSEHLGTIVETLDTRVGARVLDLGCGTGRYLAALADSVSLHTTGLDLSAGMLRMAQSRVSGRSALVCAHAETIPLPSESLDLVFCIYVDHHMASLASMLKECERTLRPGGHLVIVTSTIEQVKRFVLYRAAPELVTLEHRRLNPPEKLCREARSAGFSVSRVSSVDAPPGRVPAEFLSHIIRSRSLSVLARLRRHEVEAVAQHMDCLMHSEGLANVPVYGYVTLTFQKD